MPISTPSTPEMMAAARMINHGERWIPVVPLGTVPPQTKEPTLATCWDPSHPAEVEQAGIADDEVEPEAHDRERDDHERGRRVGEPLRQCARQVLGVQPGVEQ